MPQLNRRQFLSAGALGAAGWAAQARAGSPVPATWNLAKSRSLNKTRDPVATVCVGCDARCPILAYRDQGRVVQVAPNPAAGPGASICARAYAQVEALYDPQRVWQPLKRVGPRGGGRWQEVGWDEALEVLRAAVAADPAQAWVELGRPDPLAQPVLGKLGVTRIAGWRSAAEEAARAAQAAVFGAPTHAGVLADVRTVLLVGARPWDGGTRFAPLAKALARAKVDGAEVISIGAYQGATGSVADRWVPLKPGSEATLLRGLAHLALADPALDDTRWAPRVDAEPAALRQELEPYTAERVAAATGLSQAELRGLARRLVARPPVLVLAEAPLVADVPAATAASALLTAIGGGLGACCVERPPRPQPLAVGPLLPRERAWEAVAGAEDALPLYLAYRANPAYQSPGDAVAEAFADPRRVGQLVVMDTHLTETARLADLVLPAAADLELWNLFEVATADGGGRAALQQPAPREVGEAGWLRRQGLTPAQLFDGPGNGPLGEARQLGDVVLDLLGPADSARRAMVGYASAGAYVRARAAELVEYPDLLAKGVQDRPGAETRRAGKLAVAGKLAGDQAVEVAGGAGFALLRLEEAVLDPAFANSYRGREARRSNPLYLHTSVAAKLGLEPGAAVRVRSATGEVQAELRPVVGIHPEAVALAGGFGHWAGGAAATAGADAAPATIEPRPLTRQELLRVATRGLRRGPAAGEVPWWSHRGAGARVAELGEAQRVMLEAVKG